MHLLLVILLAASSQPAGRMIEVRGTKLSVESFGHGPPVVFLHGGMTFFDNAFAQQRDVFSASHTVIGIDQRGHGHSPDGPWKLSYPQMAEDTAAILEKLALGPVDLVGHSDGADIALLVARDHPRLVRRVVISGANLRSAVSAEDLQQRATWPAEPAATKVRELAARLPAWFRTDYARVSPDGADHYLTMLAKCYELWGVPVVLETADLKKI